VALDGVALAALARDQGVPFRAESTVMSGTPVLSTLTEGLAGARPLGLRGLLERFPDLHLAVPAEEIRFVDGECQLYGVEALPVAW